MIGYYYPEAVKHVNAAREAKSQIAHLWSQLLEDGGVDAGHHISSSGVGVVFARIDWDEQLRDALTECFAVFIDRLWAALDSLVATSVEMFRHLQRGRGDQHRFFPVSDTADGWTQLLELGCIDGVLERHHLLIRTCQPFAPTAKSSQVAQMQQSIRRLLEWESALNGGARISAWATPTATELHLPDGISVEDLVEEEPGEIVHLRETARFQLSGYSSGAVIESQSNVYVDVVFAPGFHPNDSDDTFDARLSDTIEGVQLISAAFAHETSSLSTVGITSRVDDSLIWSDAAGSNRWSRNDLEGLRASETGIGVVEGRDEFTLIVSTDDGVFERVIPRATPLRVHERLGVAAENSVQDAAATWGLPDFVFKPVVERKGAGVREIGDGLLIVGPVGAIVQTKAREGAPTNEDRERRWISKMIASATRQVFGTERRLGQSPVAGVNGRGQDIVVEPGVGWVGVVIIDHPSLPDEVVIEESEGPIPIVALVRRDWEFLFNQLRSTDAVVRYLHRVAGSAERLGGEPARYFELAKKDAVVAREPAQISVPAGAVRPPLPVLPTAPAGSDDEVAFGMVRMMLEDVATSSDDQTRTTELRNILAAIDRVPVTYRVQLGRFLLDNLAAVRSGQSRWNIRRFLGRPGEDWVAFAVAPEANQQMLESWTLLRQHERGAIEPLHNQRLVTVLLSPRSDGLRDWDSTLCAIVGDPELSEEQIVAFRRVWPNRATTG